MIYIFEMFRRIKTVFNDLYITSKTVNNAMRFLNGVNFAYLVTTLKRLSAILKSVNDIVAIVDNVKFVINAIKEIIRIIKE